MNFETKKPCASCPYRKSSQRALWSPVEFENLLEHDKEIAPGLGLSTGASFGCHKFRNRPGEEQDYCAGWLLDQKRRGLPNVQLRMKLGAIAGTGADDPLEEVTDGGFDLFSTIEEMSAYNGVPVPEGDRRVECCECGHQGLESWWVDSGGVCPNEHDGNCWSTDYVTGRLVEKRLRPEQAASEALAADLTTSTGRTRTSAPNLSSTPRTSNE